MRDPIKGFGQALHAAGALVVAASAGVGVFGVWLPMDRSLQTTTEQFAATTEYLQHEERIRDEQERLRSALSEQEDRLGRLLRRIPPETNEAELLSELTKLLPETGFSIRLYTPSGTTDRVTHKELSVQVSAESGYRGLCEFLHRLEQMPRLCHVTRLAVSTDQRDKGLYQIEMGLTTYFAAVQPSNGAR